MVNSKLRAKCPVCGTEDALDGEGTLDTCQVCGWLDDQWLRDDPDYTSKFFPISLNEAKKMWEAGKTVKKSFPNPKDK